MSEEEKIFDIFIKECNELVKDEEYTSKEIEELRNQNAELRDELEVKNAELNKEKEKNKELEKQMGKDLDVVYLQGVYNERDKWKDKIKAKIEEAKKIIDEENFFMYTETQYIKAVNQLEILESLLKEE